MNDKIFYKSATKITLLLIVISVIALNFMQIEVTEPLKTMAVAVISFYFWQKIPSSLNTNKE